MIKVVSSKLQGIKNRKKSLSLSLPVFFIPKLCSSLLLYIQVVVLLPILLYLYLPRRQVVVVVLHILLYLYLPRWHVVVVLHILLYLYLPRLLVVVVLLPIFAYLYLPRRQVVVVLLPIFVNLYSICTYQGI